MVIPTSAVELIAAMTAELDNICPEEGWNAQSWRLGTVQFLGFWDELDERLSLLDRSDALHGYRNNWKVKIGPAVRPEASGHDSAIARQHWPAFAIGFAAALDELRRSFPLAMNGNELWATPEMTAAVIPIATSVGILLDALPDWPAAPGWGLDRERGMEASVTVQITVSRLRQQLSGLRPLINVATVPAAGTLWSLRYGNVHRSMLDTTLRSLWNKIERPCDTYDWEDYKQQRMAELRGYLLVLAEIIPAEAPSTALWKLGVCANLAYTPNVWA